MIICQKKLTSLQKYSSFLFIGLLFITIQKIEAQSIVLKNTANEPYQTYAYQSSSTQAPTIIALELVKKVDTRPF